MSSPSSLQRLLALDKFSDSFGKQLQQAVDILGLDYELITCASPGVASLPKNKVFDGRVESVLRWLLSKLRVEEPAGWEPRLRAESWQLLQYLICSTPLAVVARLLQQHGFLSILQLALRDLLFDPDRVAQLSREVPILNDVPSVPDINPEVGDAANEAANKPSRKRKRDGGLVSMDPWYRESKAQPDALCGLIGHIGQSIDLIEALSRPVDDEVNSAACQQLKSAIRGNTEQASKLLGLWMEAMKVSMTRNAQTLPTKLPAECKFISLGPILHVWESRASVAASDSISVARCFTSECLLPATKLLNILLYNPNNAPLDKLDEGLRGTVLGLEQLLARHVFIPSRLFFFDARRSQRFSSSYEKATVPLDLLKELLQPVMKEIRDIAKGSRHPLRGHDVEAWHSVGVSRLFDIALRCSSRSSPKKRLDEAPWINGLYHIFTEVLRCPPNNAQHPHAGTESTYLEQILRIVIAHKVVPASDLLKATLIRDSMLTASDNAAVEWSIVAQISKLDANLFIPSKAGTKQDSQAHAPEVTHNIPQLLFHRLTTSCWTFMLANNFDRSSTASWPEGPGLGSRDYEYVRTELIVPLIRAFAQARQLRVFIEIWREQLREVYDQRVRLSGPLSAQAVGSSMSLWEDDELATALGDVMESWFTAIQIADAVDLLTESLGSDEGLNHTTTSAAASYADTIVLDALLSAVYNDDTVMHLRQRLESLQSMILNLFQNTEFMPQIGKTPHLPRIFRILRELRDLLVPFEDAEARQSIHSIMVQDVLPVADITFRGGAQGSTVNDFSQAYEAFRLIVTIGGVSEELGSEDCSRLGQPCALAVSYLRDMLAELLRTTRGGPDGNAREDLLPSWDGRPQTLHTQRTFLLAAASQLLENPLMVMNLALDIRYPLLHLLCNLSALQFSTNQKSALQAAYVGKPVPKPFTFATVWEGLLESSQLLKHYDILDELLEILCVEVKVTELNEDLRHGHVWILSPHFYHVLSIINPNAILRKRRELIFEKLMTMLQGVNRLRAVTFDTLGQHLRILIRLLSTPIASADIFRQYPALRRNPSETQCMDFRFLSNIAHYLDEKQALESHDEELERGDVEIERAKELERDSRVLFQEVVKVMLNHILANKQQDRCRDYLAAFTHAMHLKVERKPSFQKSRFALSLLKTSFQILSERAESAEHEVKGVFHQSVRTYFELLRSDLQSVFEHLQSDLSDLDTFFDDCHDINHFYDGADAVLDALAAPLFDPQSMLISSQIIEDTAALLHALSSHCMDDSSRFDLPLAVSAQKASARFASYDSRLPDIASVLPLLSEDLDARGRQGLLKAFDDSIKHLEQAKKATLMRKLLQEDVTSAPTAEELSLLTIMISNIDTPSTSTSEPDRYFFALGPRLCALIARSTSVACLGGLLHCVNLILRDKQWLVTQLCVDTVLSSIVATASPSGPSIPQEHLGPVFSGLCDLMSSLLLLHRAKLGGRFHLVVSVLQTLLRCLFLPSPRHPSRSLFPHQTPTSPSSPHDLAQAAHHVSAYTRLLTTLCDPTVSSVRASRRNQAGKHNHALTDDTKRAKSYAGQYVQYVIMEFCQCQLRAGLRPDLKEALMPGVYAMMDVVAPEAMRSMSAGMDATGRVMFKTVYDDWKGRAR